MCPPSTISPTKPTGTVESITPRAGAPEKVTKRIVIDLDGAPFPTKPIVPSTEVVQ